MERLLVTGIDHPLGSNLALALVERFEVLGLYSQDAIECGEFATSHADPGNRLLLDELGQDWRPQWIIHCGPLSSSSWDATGSEQLPEQEPRMVAQWAKLADELSARLTVISSDVVFSGPRMFHEEMSPAHNPSPRAAQVRAMERALEHTSALVIRTHAYGWSPVPDHADFAQRAYESLVSGRPVEADGRRHATPILATDLAELLVRAYEKRIEGLHHLSGAERTSPFRFVSQLATAFGLHAPNESSTATSTSTDGETSLNSKRARRVLEMATPMLREGLNRFAEQAQQGWRNRCRWLGRIGSAREIAA